MQLEILDDLFKDFLAELNILDNNCKHCNENEGGEELKILDFVSGCLTNLYGTKCYIVKQCLFIYKNNVENNILLSYDTFYARTKERDKKYEA